MHEEQVPEQTLLAKNKQQTSICVVKFVWDTSLLVAVWCCLTD